MKHALKFLRLAKENYEKEANRIKDLDNVAYTHCMAIIQEIEVEILLLESPGWIK